MPARATAPLHPVPEALHDVAFVDDQEMAGRSLYAGLALATMDVLLTARVSVGAAKLCALVTNGERNSAETHTETIREPLIFGDILMRLFNK